MGVIGREAGLTFTLELDDMMQNFLLNRATQALLLHFTVKRYVNIPPLLRADRRVP